MVFDGLGLFDDLGGTSGRSLKCMSEVFGINLSGHTELGMNNGAASIAALILTDNGTFELW